MFGEGVGGDEGLPVFGESPAAGTGARGQSQGKDLADLMNGPTFGEGTTIPGQPSSETSLIMHRFGFRNGADSVRGKQQSTSGPGNANPLL